MASEWKGVSWAVIVTKGTEKHARHGQFHQYFDAIEFRNAMQKRHEPNMARRFKIVRITKG